MLQNFLEKFLIEKVGKVVDGLTKENLDLGLWSGNFVFRNLKLKPELLVSPAIPYQLTFSHIGVVAVNVPWSKLSSESVELMIEDLSLVLSPLDPEGWETISTYDEARRLDELDKLIRHYLRKASKEQKKASPSKDTAIQTPLPTKSESVEEEKTQHKAEENEKKNSFFGRLGIKVRENMKITIKNIHVRIEDQNLKYSGGFTVEEIKIFSTNLKGEPQFIDRTLPENANLPLRRPFIIKNFAMYWNNNSDDLIANTPNESRVQNLRDTVVREGKTIDAKTSYIVIASFDAIPLFNFRKSKTLDEETPFIDLTLHVKPFEISFTIPQIKSIKKLLDYSYSYQDYLKIKAQKLKEITKLEFSESEMIDEYVPRFKKLISRALYQREKLDTKEARKSRENILRKCWDIEETRKVLLFLYTLPMRYYSWTVKEAVKAYDKERRIRALKEKKESGGKGIFGLFSFKKEQETLVTSEDVLNIEATLKQNLDVPDWKIPTSDKKERQILNIHLKNNGMVARYYEDEEKQKELGCIQANLFEKRMRGTIKGRHLFYSRRIYQFMLELKFDSENLSFTEQLLGFISNMNKTPLPIESMEKFIRSKVLENSIATEGKLISNTISLSPIWYENYTNEEDTLDERA